MEAAIHELLYVRRIYPRSTFAPHRHLGVACHANRHPGIVDYIYGFLTVAIPALLAGTAEELALVIQDSPPGRPDVMLERFVFDFDTSGFGRAKEEMMSAVGTDQEAEEADLVRYLDPRMRDMLLQIVSMDGVDLRRRRNCGEGGEAHSGNLTFKLCLRVARSTSDSSYEKGGSGADAEADGPHKPPPPCAELEGALREGTWFHPRPEACGFGDGGPRPGRVPTEVTSTLGGLDAPTLGIRMEMKMEVEP